MARELDVITPLCIMHRLGISALLDGRYGTDADAAWDMLINISRSSTAIATEPVRMLIFYIQ
jgi:hypothetical protein